MEKKCLRMKKGKKSVDCEMELRLLKTRTGEKENLRINKARGKKLEMHWCVTENTSFKIV